jgi:multidrug resistance efflux pump
MAKLKLILNWLLRQPLWFKFAGLAVVVLAGWLLLSGGRGDATALTFGARRGNLNISVLEGGSVEASEAQEIRSEVKGFQGTKILKIVDEGTLITEEDVRNGKVLVELDNSEIRQRIITQDIQFQSTLAAFIDTQQAYDIQVNQNKTDIKAAQQKARFALMDFEKYMGANIAAEIIRKLQLFENTNITESASAELLSPLTENNLSETMSGLPPTNFNPTVSAQPPVLSPAFIDPLRGQSNHVSAAAVTRVGPTLDFTPYAKLEVLGDGTAKQTLRKLMDDLQMAKTQQRVGRAKLDGSERLFKKGFITKTEFEAEQINYENMDLKVQSGETALALFSRYEFVKAAEEFLSKYEESLRGLERGRKEAVSKLAQSRARLKASEGRYNIEVEQRRDLYEQFSKCVIKAEKTGLVVYGNDGRMFGGEQIREGASVRERQRIITIPDMAKMSVRVKIHESSIKKIVKGQRARVVVDAFADEPLSGEVGKVGVLPDSQDRWLNPDLKVYLTVIDVSGVRSWLKPGMSAKVEIFVKSLTNVVFIPLQAVFTTKGKQFCLVSSTMGVQQREIQTGDFNDEFIEVKAGLKEREKVLLQVPPSTGETDEADRHREEAEPEPGDTQSDTNGVATNGIPTNAVAPVLATNGAVTLIPR